MMPSLLILLTDIKDGEMDIEEKIVKRHPNLCSFGCLFSSLTTLVPGIFYFSSLWLSKVYC